MSTTTISFIGGGNMARSIIGGLIDRAYPAGSITVGDPHTSTLDALKGDFGVSTTQDNAVASTKAQVLVLAVKPQIMKNVCLSLREHLRPDTLVVSIAAGITCASLARWLGDVPIVRCMPNTPALVQCGASGLFANERVDQQQRQQATTILSAVGTVCWVEREAQIDAITAVSGSGPAYFFFMLECMTEAGERLGLDRDTASRLAIQTAAGAAKLAAASDGDLAELRRRVTSPGGTTERAIDVFEQQDLRGIVDKAMEACAARSVELASTLDE